jgi:hypothetical protein
MRIFVSFAILTCAGTLPAQDVAPAQDAVQAEPAKTGDYLIETGTKIPLTLINSISTKHSVEGDRVYLETAFPIMVKGRIVIPPGSYVAGTVTEIKRPGRVKGRGELFLRFDSLTLPNGVTRDFRARIGTMDGSSPEDFDRKEGKITSEGNKTGDLHTIEEATTAGASAGIIGGIATGHYGMGAGIGAAAGAAAGLMGVLLTRGPDAVLAKGSTIEMILDRQLHFQDTDLKFGPMQPVQVSNSEPPVKRDSSVIPTRRFPF